MAVAFVRNHTAGTSTTSGTTVSATTSAATGSGNTLYAFLSFDNDTATTPTVTSISKPGGEGGAWVLLGYVDSPASGDDMGVRSEIWGITTTTSWASGTTVTATLGAAQTSKVILLAEFSGAGTTVRSSGSASYAGTATTYTASAATVSSGDLVLGLFGVETITTITTLTDDSDTTAGSWSTASTGQADTGTGHSSIHARMQYKITTGAGAQSFDPATNIARDGGSVVVALEPAVTAKQGSATDAYAYTDTATGQRIPKASATDGYNYTDSATGTAPVLTTPTGSATDTYVFTDTATGVNPGDGPRTFTPPVAYEAIPTHQKPFKYYQQQVSLSVVFRNGHFQTVRVPSQEETTVLVEGVTWFSGGRPYLVTAETAALLAADGFTTT